MSDNLIQHIKPLVFWMPFLTPLNMEQFVNFQIFQINIKLNLQIFENNYLLIDLNILE